MDTLATLRARANKAKDKAASRVSSETRFGIITSFLNDETNEIGFEAVESVYRLKNPGKPLAQIAASFNATIKDNALDELVYAVAMDEHVYLTLLTDDEDDEQSENDQ